MIRKADIHPTNSIALLVKNFDEWTLLQIWGNKFFAVGGKTKL